jgi:Rrf2 family protein
MLKISEAASLALHTMALLAAYPEEFFTNKEIASKIKSSESHLAKVLQRLVKEGFVKSERGPRGGFILGKDAHRCTLLDIYECIDGSFTASDCLSETPSCSGEKCILDGVLRNVNTIVEKYFTKTKLSELAGVYRG